MTRDELLDVVATGEDSHTQFKRDVRSPEQLAAEVVAFSNGTGGVIYVGVDDGGSLVGLDAASVRRLNQMVSNVASTFIHSPVAVETENVKVGRRVVMAIRVSEGTDKPYFDKDGVIWLKVGADKRRVNSKEQIRRFFEETSQMYADENATRARVADLDLVRLRNFLEERMQTALPMEDPALVRLLGNMNLLHDNGNLNLAGTLMFARHPEYIVPQFIVKAVRFPGTDVGATSYLDSEDFAGPLQAVYDGVMGFLSRNLRKRQPKGGVNYPGEQVIPAEALSELVVNALVHRDYFVSAPVRVFIFDDRVEIVSPGHLPNHLTVEKVLMGNSVVRNPVLVSYVARGLLPYHGLGSGIARIQKMGLKFDLVDDREGCLFKAVVWTTSATPATSTATGTATSTATSTATGTATSTVTGTATTTVTTAAITTATTAAITTATTTATIREKILVIIQEKPQVTADEIANAIGGIGVKGVRYHLDILKKEKGLRYEGNPMKGGHWVVP